MEQETYQDDDEDQESFAYSDYNGVVVMIQTYYYRCLELFRKYYLMRLKDRDNVALKQEIQSYIFTTAELMRNYDPIKQDNKLKENFKKINGFAGTLKNINFDKMKECVNMLVDASYILGLSKLEFKKHKRENHLDKYRKGL